MCDLLRQQGIFQGGCIYEWVYMSNITFMGIMETVGVETWDYVMQHTVSEVIADMNNTAKEIACG